MKFFIISYHGDSRGNRLSNQLVRQFPEYIKTNHEESEYLPWMKPPVIKYGYTVYHYNSRPFFEHQFHNELTLPEKFDPFTHPDARLLSHSKYNIIVTHAYTADKIHHIKKLFQDHEIIICGITYHKNNIEYLIERNYALKKSMISHMTKEALYIHYTKYLGIQTPHDITVSLDRLINDDPRIDLTDIYEYIKQKMTKEIP